MSTENRIRFWRQQRGWTLQQLAEATGTTRAQIDKLERGHRRLTVDWMVRLAKPLGCDPRSLMTTAPHPATTAAPDRIPLHPLQAQPRARSFLRLPATQQLPRPYFLEQATAAYAVLWPGTALQPAARKGQQLLLNPQTKPRKNQITAACLQNGTMVFGLYVGQTKQQITLQQLHPRSSITLPSASITALHPVVAVIDG